MIRPDLFSRYSQLCTVGAYFIGIVLTFFCHSSFSNPIHTYTTDGPLSESDTRYLFEYGILKLALEETVDEYGPYILNRVDEMSHSRALVQMSNNSLPNYVRTFGYSEKLESDRGLSFIPIPIFRGVLGFRTCFTSKKIAKEFSKMTSMNQLRELTHGQGQGWHDVDILKYNGFKVHESPVYDGLFKMIDRGRIDLFCRGATEVKDEYERYKHLDNFAYDRSKVFYYPYPNFLYMHNSNAVAMERIQKGLLLTLKNGKFDKLWDERIGPNVQFSMQDERTLIRLENPLLKGLSGSFEKYYHPMFLDKLDSSKTTALK